MPIDISSVLENADQFTKQGVQAGNELFNLSLNAAVVSSDDAKVYSAIGANSAIIDSAKQNAELTTQTMKIKGANLLGTNLKAQGEMVSGLSQTILEQYALKDAAAKEIQKKQSVGLFDNPLEHIINLFTVNDDIDKHNAANERLVSAETQLDNLNRLTQSTNLTQSQLTESITAASVDASAKNTALTAQLNANKATKEALAYNADGISKALSVSKEILSTQFNGLNAQNAQTNVGIALQHLELSRQEFDWRKDEKKIADQARDKNTDIDNYAMDRINDGLQRMGMQPIPKGSPRAGNALALMKAGSGAGAIYAEAFKISNDSELAGGATILAPSPARAVELLHSVPIKLTSAQGPVKDILDSATATVAAAGQAGTIDLKDKAVREAAINKAAITTLANQARKIIPGDNSNVFQIAPLGALINAAPELQTLPVVSKVIAPALAAGSDLSNPDTVFHTAMVAMDKGQISYEEMVEGLSYVYQRGVKVNLEARQLQSLGLNLEPKKKGDPSMMTFNVPISTGNLATFGMGGKTTIDMTNVVDISREVNKMLAARDNPFINRTPY